MQWASCLDEEDWFPPLEKVSEDINLEQAIWKPVRKGGKYTLIFQLQ